MAHWDEENDIVWICPNDTKGKVINVYGLSIGLPKQPPREEILFHDLHKKDQMWMREEMPKELLAFETDEEYQEEPKEFKAKWDEWIFLQYKRRKEGVWFYNNGVPTYLTGAHWFALQWVKQDFGYPFYLEPQAELEYHWAACVADPRCYGQNLVKNRRFGWSTLAGSGMLEYTTRTKNTQGAILSKTAKDAKEVVFQQKIVYPFNNLPFFFKPITDGNTDPKRELVLKPPASKITKNQKKRQSGFGLNSVISWQAPSNNAFDGFKVGYFLHDESGKYEKPNNIEKSWQVQKRCLEIRNKIIGKCRMGSTVNPMKKGGEEYKSLFYDGLIEGENVEGRNQNGRTKSGLYSIFIPAYRCIIYDVYGNSVVEDPKEPIETIDGDVVDYGGKTFLNRTRDSLKDDPVKYNEEIRQMPFSIREAFMDTLDDCVFNLQKIEEQRTYNENMTPNPVVRGNFAWKDGVIDGKVEWQPDNKAGRFNIVWLPKPDNRSIIDRNKKPPFDWQGVGGVDPYAVDTAAYGEGSKGALYLFNKTEPNGASNMFVLEYVKRAKSLDMFYEDCLMAAVFYGYPLLIESNKYDIAHYFRRRGYSNYLLNRPTMSFAAGTRPSITERNKKGVYANQDVIRSMDAMLESYVNNYVGYNDDGEMGNLYFETLLGQLKSYTPQERGSHDAIAAAGHALYAARIDIRKEVRETGRVNMVRRYKMS